MKKLYLLFIVFTYSFLGFSQADCNNAALATEGSTYSVTLEPFVEQWYKFTMPKDGKLQIIWTNSENALITLLSGECGDLVYQGDGLGLISYLLASKDEEFWLRIQTFGFGNADTEFEIFVNDPAQGDVCSDPIAAVTDNVGINSVPATLNQYIWYQFQMPSTAKKITITNPSNLGIDLYAENCSRFMGSNYFDQTGDFVTVNPQPDDVVNIRFTLDGTGDFDWDLILEDFTTGDNCNLAQEAVDGTNHVPVSNNPSYWYSYTMPAEGGRLEITSTVYNGLQVFSGECSNLQTVTSAVQSTFVSELSPNEEVFIKWQLNQGSDFDFDVSVAPLVPGDICASAQALTLGENILAEGKHADYWYSYTVQDDNTTLLFDTDDYDATYQVYSGDCNNLTTLISDGFRDEEVTGLAQGDQIFVRWKINGRQSLTWTVNTPTPVDQTITFDPLVDKSYGDSDFELTAAASSGLDVNYTSSNTSVATISGSIVTIVGVGSTDITASQEGDPNYNAAPDVVQELVVTKGAQTITFPSIADKTNSDADFDLTAAASSGLDVSYASSNTSVATISGSTVTIVGLGSTDITASQNGDGNYNAAADVIQELVVSKIDQTITFAAIADKTYGDSDFNLVATASSGLAVSYANSNTAIATISGNTVTIISAGSTSITASQGGDANYNAAVDEVQTFTVAKANQTISFDAIADKLVTDADFSIPASTTSSLTLSYQVSGPATISGNTLSLTGETGTVTVIASQVGNDNYNVATDVEVSFLVTDPTKTDQTITFNEIDPIAYDALTLNLSGTVSSGLDLTYESSNTNVATVDGNVVTILSVGTTIITVSQEGDGTYNPAASVDQELVINKADQIVSITAIPDKEVSSEAFEIQASASSNLELTYAITGPASISGTTITLDGTLGTVKVVASQVGNNNYNSASASVSFVVLDNRIDQAISITDIADKFTDAAPFEIEASTTSDLELTYTISGPATLAGTTITLDGTVGTVEIVASQTGNDNYNSATNSVSFEVLVNPCLGFVASATVTSVSCNGSADGTISIETTEGTAPFAYSLADGDAVESNIFSDLSEGDYSIVVTDANGCTTTATATIESPDALEITAEVVNNNGNVTGNGSISLTVSGGTAEYSYSWSNGETTASISELEFGEYSVTVTDANGCSVDDTFTIDGVTANESAIVEEVLIYPNPSKDVVKFEHSVNVKLLQLYDARGKLLNELATNGTKSKLNVSDLSNGIYFIRANGTNHMYRFVKE